MAKKKTFRAKLSFNAADIMQHNHLNIERSGISMPLNIDIEDYKKGLFGYSKDKYSFGWAGNDPKFYGDVQKGVAPKPEDFIEVPFRLISATIVGGGTWKATDFSNATILKKSVKMLDGKTVYKDHETDTDNWVGIVNGVKWSDAFDSNGVKVPAGIDGILAIDQVTNPKVARGAMMGTIYSNSVTVEFDWEMSHKFENEWDFLNKIGTIGTDGKMIRRVVTAIYNYHETSLVWLGADPFAKAYTEDNKLKNIDVGSVYQYAKAKPDEARPTEDTENKYKERKTYSVNLGFGTELLPLSKNGLSSHSSNSSQKISFDMKQFIAAFMKAFGTQLNLTAAELEKIETPDGFVSHIEELSKKVTFENPNADTTAQLEAFKAVALTVAKEAAPETTDINPAEFMKTHTFVKTEELSTLKTTAGEVEQLKKDKSNLEAEAALGKNYLAAKRTQAIKLYKATVGADEADAAVIDLFNKADDKAIDGLLAQYGKTATAKFSGHCKKCQSTEIEFKSSVEVEGEEHEGGAKSIPDVSFKALQNEFTKPTFGLGRTTEKAAAE